MTLTWDSFAIVPGGITVDGYTLEITYNLHHDEPKPSPVESIVYAEVGWTHADGTGTRVLTSQTLNTTNDYV